MVHKIKKWAGPVDEEDSLWVERNLYQLESVTINAYEDSYIRVFINSEDKNLIFHYLMKNRELWGQFLLYQFDCILVPVNHMDDFMDCCAMLSVRDLTVTFNNEPVYLV